MTPSGPRTDGPQPARTRATAWVLGLLAALPSVLVSLPVAADWLVMTDGSRLETRGSWSVDGRQVLFTRPNGTLSAVRAREVDLQASEALTRQKSAEDDAEESPLSAEKPEPHWTFTNEDIPQAARVQEQIEIELLVGAEGFSLMDVEEETDATGANLVVRGTLVNEADIPASVGTVRVLVVSPIDGGTIDVAQATLGSTQLLPNSATSFTASFENLSPGFGVVQVEVQLVEEQDELDFG